MQNFRIRYYSRLFVAAIALAILVSNAETFGSAKLSKWHGRNLSEHLVVGTTVRNYNVHIPPGYSETKSVPLILVLHGGGGNAQCASWDSCMARQADKENFLAVFPNGTGPLTKYFLTWNAGSCCGPAVDNNENDVAFISKVIDKLASEYNIDKRRVYVAGLSNGGMMAYRLGCELSGKIAAIASVEGCMLCHKPDSIEPISVISIHGKNDTVVRYNGGVGSMLGYKIHATPVRETIDWWVKATGCAAVPTREKFGTAVKETYSGGKANSQVCLFTLEGRHSWPGGRIASPVADWPSNEIDATAEICKFFWAHPKHESR